MSSSYTPLVHLPKLVDENPTLLTIRKVESADANDDGAARSLFGANASEYGFESSQAALPSLGCVNPVRKLGFETSKPVTTIERSRLLEVATTTGRVGVQRAEDVEIDNGVEKRGSGFRTWSYGGGGRTGGKILSSHRGNKRTPYERPVTGRHATAGGSSNMGGSVSLPSSKKVTLASWLRDSTTRLIHSSAAILFSAVFKRSSPSVEANGDSQGVSIAVKQETSDGMPDAPTKQNSHDVLASQFPPLIDADVKPVEADSSVLDIGKVEEILKQKTWSRDQVNRLTQILQRHMLDTTEADKSVGAEKLQDQPGVDTRDTSPTQVARSYMGKQATRPSGLAATVRTSAFLSSQAQSSSERTLAEDRYASSPFSRGWAGASAFVRMPKRNLVIEDDVSLMGPIRRVRQKTSLLVATASPYSYSRRMTGLSKPPEIQFSSPLSQSSQTAKKILETLEKLSPSPQRKLLGAMTEKSVNGSQVLDEFSPPRKGKVVSDIVSLPMTGASKHTLEISKAREKSVLQNLSLAASPKSAEAKVNGKPTFGVMNFTEVEVKKPSFETPSFMSQSYNFPMLSKGFRMNAVFEERISDVEAKLQTKPQLSSVAKDSKEEANLTPMSVVPFAKANVSASSAISLSEPVQASSLLTSSSASFFMANSSTPHIAADSPEPVDNLLSLPSFSYPAVAMETRPMLSDAAVSSSAAVLSEKKGQSALNMAAVEPAAFVGSTAVSEPTVVSTTIVTSVSAFECTPTALPVSCSVGTGNDVSGVSSPVLPTLNTHIDPFPLEKVVPRAIETHVTDNQGEGDTMATEFVPEGAIPAGASFVLSVPNLSYNASLQPSTSSTFSFAAGTSGTSLSTSACSVENGSCTGSVGCSASSLSSTSPFSVQSSTTFAPNSLSGASASLPSAPAFAFGGQSIGVKSIFATEAPVSSLSACPFTFGAQSGTVTTGQQLNLAAKPIFGQTCSSSTKQAPCFAASPSSLANYPFQSTGASSSSSMFGSSNVAVSGPTSASSSLSSVFTSSSSSIGGSLSIFQFGAPALSSSISGLAASSTTANPFTTSLFSSSAALGITAFSYCSAAALPTIAGSASTTTQNFAFSASRPNPFTANTFPSSGTLNSPFNFGATAPFSSANGGSSVSFGSSTSSNLSNVFAFGSASTSKPSPFAFGSGQLSTVQVSSPAPLFGNQPAVAPPNNGQPLGFNGGQSAAIATAPAPNIFPADGAAQSGLGFALGATGGDKSGRKFVKAKRIGGAKKGK